MGVTPASNADWSIARKRFFSALYGAGSAGLVGLIGPIWAAALLILLFPLVFRRVANVAVELVLVAFALSWLVVIGVRPPLISNAPLEWWTIWVGMSVVPLLVAGLTLLLRGRRSLGSG